MCLFNISEYSQKDQIFKNLMMINLYRDFQSLNKRPRLKIK